MDAGASISNSYGTGAVTAITTMGGLVGFNEGNVINSYSTSNVNGTSLVGGLVGENNGNISNSYASGIVNSDGGFFNFGSDIAWISW